ncbi:MAG: hypothetical protein VYE62_08745, partial [Pseudomonadota bacterium]|nr:hypothetical protein [Pseudomonadota bacterium]
DTRINMAIHGKTANVPVCSNCGSVKSYVHVRRPMSDAGPLIALRYAGDGPNFQIEQTICRNCGKLSSVREVLRNDRFAAITQK